MTVCGGWSLVSNDTRGTRAITLWCRSWCCVDCAPFRAAALKRMGMEGKPTTFITLTVNPAHGQDRQERARQLSDAWKIVVKRARRKFTKAPLEYLAVFEETKKGEPHLHIIARAPYIPQKWLSDQMMELIEAPIVDIRKVHKAKEAAKYISKYVGKGPKAFASLKRYWQSKGWAPAQTKPDRRIGDPHQRWAVWQEPLCVIKDILSQWGRPAVWISDNEIFLEAVPWSPRAGP